MIDYTYKDLYYQSSVDKQLKIEAEDGTVITNEDLYLEEMTLSESLCSASALTFGSCEASTLKLKIANRFSPLYGQWITVSETLDGHTDEPFQFGIYKVWSDEPAADRIYREITAYDAMYDIINADKTEVADWYNMILPTDDSYVLMRTFRRSFINFFGLEEESVELVNDNMFVYKTISADELSGLAIINAICEINGCFGHIGRDGKFQYITLTPIASEEQNAIVGTAIVDKAIIGSSPADTVETADYREGTYEDYECEGITQLQIREEEGDVGVTVGDGDNCYIIEGNFLVYGKESIELQEIGENILSVISGLVYRPASVTVTGNPCVTVGDAFIFNTKYQDINTYVLTREFKGIQAPVDDYGAEGVENYSESGTSLESVIDQIKGKSNVLTRTIDETKSEIKDVEAGLTSTIIQTTTSLEVQLSSIQDTVDNLSKETLTGAITEYYKSTSSSELVGGEWSEETPEWEEGTYIWVRTTIRMGDGSTTISEPVCITGNTGLSGTSGEDGISVISIVAYYAISQSRSYYPSHGGDDLSLVGSAVVGSAILGNSGEWYTEMPDVGDDEFLWLAFLVTYSNGVTAWTEPCCLTDESTRRQISVINEKNASLELTLDGLEVNVDSLAAVVSDNYEYSETKFAELTLSLDEFSTTLSSTTETIGSLQTEAITGTVIEYYLSTSPTELEGGTWSTDVPTWTEGYYIWTQTTITTGIGDSESSSTTEPVCITGNDGTSGLDGISVDKITAYYAVTESDSFYPSHEGNATAIVGSAILGTAILGDSGLWYTEMPSMSDTEYLWICYLIDYSDGHSDWTVPFCVTDASVRNQLSSTVERMSQIEQTLDGIDIMVSYLSETVYQDHTETLEKIGEINVTLDSITSTVSETQSTISDLESETTERLAQIDQTLEGIDITVSYLNETVNEYYTDTLSQIGEINVTLTSITSTVSETQTSISNLENQAVTGTVIEFYLSTSQTEPTGGTWSTDVPEWSEGYYIWMRTTVTTGIGDSVEISQTAPVCITGNDGLDGIGVESITAYYAVTESDSYYPSHNGSNTAIVGSAILGTAILGDSGSWYTEMPSVSDNEYLWICYLIEYSDGHTEWTEPYCTTDASIRQQLSSTVERMSQIEQTLDGIDIIVSYLSETVYENYTDTLEKIGEINVTLDSITSTVSETQSTVTNLQDEAITGTVIEFYLSTSSTETIGGEWSETTPTWEEGYYVWIRTTVTTGIGSSAETTQTAPICITGNDGTSGLDGIGVESITAYYAVSESDSYYPSHNGNQTSIVGSAILGTAILGDSGTWYTEMPSVSDTEYLWVCYLVKYTDGREEWTEPYCTTDASVRKQLSSTIERMSQIEQTLDGIDIIVSYLSEQVYEDHTETLQKIGEINITLESITSTVSETQTKISDLQSETTERLAQIDQTLEGIDITVSTLNETVASNYTETSSQIGEINVQLDSIKSTVSDTQSIVTDLQSETVTGTVIEYYLSTSSSELEGGSWSTTAPTWTEGYYIWIKTTITTGIGSSAETSETEPICITGNDGTSGIDGIGVDSITAYYAKSESDSYYPSHGDTATSIVGTAVLGTAILGNSGTWYTEMPDMSDNDYLWVCYLIEYSNGRTEWTVPHCVTDASVRKQLSSTVERMSQIEQTLDGIDIIVSSLSEEVYTDYTETIEKIGEINVTLESIRSTVSETESTVTNLQDDAITGTVIEYYLSTSSTELIGGSWSKTAPEWTEGCYVWTKTIVTVGVGDSARELESDAVCITGNTGAAGESGLDGISVENIVAYYAITESDSFYPSHNGSNTAIVGTAILGTAILGDNGSWYTYMPTVGDNEYLWICYLIEYSDNRSAWTEPYCVTDASTRTLLSSTVERIAQIEQTLDEIDIVVSYLDEKIYDNYSETISKISEIDVKLDSITSTVSETQSTVIDLTKDVVTGTTVEYYLSTSPSEPIGGEWVDNPPAWTEGYYIWIRTTVTTGIGDSSYPSTTEPVCITGNDGTGIDSITAYYSISESSTFHSSHGGDTTSIVGSAIIGTSLLGDSGEWTEEMPNVGYTEYLWVCYLIEYSDGHSDWTEPFCVTDDSVRSQLSYTTERLSQIEQTLDGIDIIVSYLNQTVEENYSYTIEKIGEIDVRLDSIVSTVSETKSVVTDLQSEAITGTVTEYYLSTSSTTPTGGSWSTTAPAWTEGYYIWMRTTITTWAGDTTTTSAVCITGNDGTSGIDGIGVEKITAYYAVTESDSYYPSHGNTATSIVGTAVLGTAILGNSGTWYNEMPLVNDTEYLWICYLVEYSDGHSDWTEPYCTTDASVRGQLSATVERMSQIEQTLDGIDITVSYLSEEVYANYSDTLSKISEINVTLDSISSTVSETHNIVTDLQSEAITATVTEYYLSTSSTIPTGGSWSTTAPAWTEGYYIWMRTTITTGTGETTTTSAVCITGNDGTSGIDGTGVESITAYYAVTESDSYYPSHSGSNTAIVGSAILGTAILGDSGTWYTEMPSVSDIEYLWVCYLIEYSDGRKEWTEPFCVTDESVRSQLNSTVERVSKIEQTVEGIDISVSTLRSDYDDLEEKVAKISLTADSIKLEVIDGQLGSKAQIVMTVGDTTSKETIDLQNVRQSFADDTSKVEIQAGSVGFISNTFYVESTNFTVSTSGVITAKSGTIGGWTITSTQIMSSSSFSVGGKEAGLALINESSQPWLIAQDSSGNATFRINRDGSAYFAGQLSAATGTFAGSLSAATGSFAGSITASSGTIGGWTISSSRISSSSSFSVGGKEAGLALINESSQPWIIAQDSSGNTTFKIERDGSVFISTSLTATTGTIGGWTITSTRIMSSSSFSVGSKEAGLALINESSQPWLIAQDSSGNATFRINRDGSAYLAGELSAATGTFAGSLSAAKGTFAGSLSAATGTFAGELVAATGSFSGSITATSGTIGGWTISSTSISSSSSFSVGGKEAGVTLRTGNYFIYAQDSKGNITFNIDSDGNAFFAGELNAATGTFAGSLSAATGTFAGSLSAATGTFAGSLSAAKGTFAGSLSAATGTFAGELVAATGSFSGSITATSGTIGGWTISSTSISSSSSFSVGGKEAGVTLRTGNYFIYAQDSKGNITFNIDSDGNAFFAGELNAATGTFAGSLSAATGTFSGKLSAATGTFAGELSAATGTFSGSITATSGTIGGWTISSSRISSSSSFSVGSKEAGLALINESSQPWLIAQDSSGNATFRINRDGSAYFAGELSAATGSFSGSITATSGTIGGWYLSSTRIMSISGLTLGSSGAGLALINEDEKPFLVAQNENNVQTFRIDRDGSAMFAGQLSAATGTFAGSLSAAAGTFAGELKAATGSFSGSITATSGTIGSWNITSSRIMSSSSFSIGGKEAGLALINDSTLPWLIAQDSNGDPTFWINYDGSAHFSGTLNAASGTFYGELISKESDYDVTISSGDIMFYHEDIKVGKISSSLVFSSYKDLGGITIGLNDNGNFISFSYYSENKNMYYSEFIYNHGLNPNDRRHTFQFLDTIYASSDIYLENYHTIYAYDDNENIFQLLHTSFDDDSHCMHLGNLSSYEKENKFVTYIEGWKIYLRESSGIYVTSTIIVDSDESLKKDIEVLNDKYINLLDNMEPVRFKHEKRIQNDIYDDAEDTEYYINGNVCIPEHHKHKIKEEEIILSDDDDSSSYHFGYIANKVKDAAEQAGLTEEEIGFYVKDTGNGYSALAYDEIIPLLHLKIKQLESRIEQLEAAN